MSKTSRRRIRICAVQYPRDAVTGWDDVRVAVGRFVESAVGEKSDIILFPEAFTAQLLTTSPPGAPKELIRRLAEDSHRYVETLSSMAQEAGIHIIGGSHPLLRDQKLFNVSHWFTPEGGIHTQEKLHTTPREKELWGMEEGEELKVFETPWGKLSVLVCYDIEFPEIARLLALEGVEVVFVPYSTRNRAAYLRVRHTARARAVENGLYVVIAGNVGHITTPVDLLASGQAAVFTPSDDTFPPDGILAESTFDRPESVLADLDLDLLDHHRRHGTVRPLADLRHDLYEVRGKIGLKTERLK